MPSLSTLTTAVRPMVSTSPLQAAEAAAIKAAEACGRLSALFNYM